MESAKESELANWIEMESKMLAKKKESQETEATALMKDNGRWNICCCFRFPGDA